ncbi:hypothetical protein VTN00DRAFT_382 [Thermoascus crustaceus]|uniref:uncharacterized protein n=1 Tax=Thermoascus crustaceus TaxID=5088 RepID=UPI0037448FC0
MVFRYRDEPWLTAAIEPCFEEHQTNPEECHDPSRYYYHYHIINHIHRIGVRLYSDIKPVSWTSLIHSRFCLFHPR